MDSEQLLEFLLQRDIIEETEDSGQLRLSNSYRERVTAEQNRLEGADKTEVCNLVQTRYTASEASMVIETCEGDLSPIAKYLAMDLQTDEYDDRTRLRLLLVIEQLYQTVPDDGVPQSFMSIHPGQLSFALNLYERAIVYVWRHDCPPCEQVRKMLDSLVPEPLDDIALFAVYGPEDPRFLYEQYNVIGGPTTLFLLNGEVDVRLSGTHYTTVIETEIDKLRSFET